MATVNKAQDVRMRGMAAVAAVVLMMMAVATVARPVKIKDTSCSTSDEYVYPYESSCDSPAELFTGYQYLAIWQGYLLPEYDETNATFYLRLSTDSGATYVAITESTNSGTLLVNFTVYIFNIESKRAVTWRQEGTDEYFLIEQDVSSVTEGARFRFVQGGEEVFVPCLPNTISVPQCHAYYLVSDLAGASSAPSTSFLGAGLQTYEEGSTIYIKAATEGSAGDLPILLIPTNSTTTTTSANMLLPTIRSVTAPQQ